MDGLSFFCKYAFPPNRLQYCGPDDFKHFFEALSDNEREEMENLALKFEGAIPYLKLIAQANGIKDIFDYRVAEAYWLGNDLLNNVKLNAFHSHIESRFEKKMGAKNWRWVEHQPAHGAKPFHGFHVFDIYRHAGLLKSGSTNKIIETMDKCRISWGKIISVDFIKNAGDLFLGNAVIERLPLKMGSGELQLGEKRAENFHILDTSLKEGDDVSLHWDFVCDRLALYQKNNLAYWTNFHLSLTNKII